MERPKIDISGLDKPFLLKNLWRYAFESPMNFGPSRWQDDWDRVAETAVNGPIDYFKGRAIKTDLSKDEVDPWLYDRDAGEGTFASVVARLRQN
jgi:hypothetical protein